MFTTVSADVVEHPSPKHYHNTLEKLPKSSVVFFVFFCKISETMKLQIKIVNINHSMKKTEGNAALTWCNANH